jgi:Uma2 family endonuclease
MSGYVRLLNLGVVGAAPFAVRLWAGGPAREPDVFYISRNKLPQLTSKQFEGGPDLVVEIVSRGSVREDKVDKLIEYERAGVGEYWLLDPRPRQKTAEFLLLSTSGIYQPVEVGEDGRYDSMALPGFTVYVDWFWQDPLPNYQYLIAQMMAGNEQISPELRQLYQNLAHSLK